MTHELSVVLDLSTGHLKLIRTHGEQTYPNECCGLLLGTIEQRRDSLVKTLVEVRSTDNAWSSEQQDLVPIDSDLTKTLRDCYWIAPEDLLATQRYARNHDLEIIGVYHSHPNHPAIPSKFDQALAWPQYSYMIVSVQNGIAQDLRSWMLDHSHTFQPEDISVHDPVKV